MLGLTTENERQKSLTELTVSRVNISNMQCLKYQAMRSSTEKSKAGKSPLTCVVMLTEEVRVEFTEKEKFVESPKGCVRESREDPGEES